MDKKGMDIEEFYENILTLVDQVTYGSAEANARILTQPETATALIEMREQYGWQKFNKYIDLANATIRQLKEINNGV